VARILRRRIEKKIEKVLAQNLFGFTRGKRTRDAIQMLRMISETNVNTDEEPCACFID
jgi:hypothetical protein